MAPSAAATDLRVLFEPRSVALIGASADPSSISARPLRLLRQHSYAGGLSPGHPKYQGLAGSRVDPALEAGPSPRAPPAPPTDRCLSRTLPTSSRARASESADPTRKGSSTPPLVCAPPSV